MVYTLTTTVILVLGLALSTHAGTIEADDEGNIIATVPDGKKIFLRQGTAAAVDIVGEAKLARREAAINGACDVTVTEVVDKVAGLVETLSKTASDTASANAKMAADVATKQQAMNELLTEMVNITATAVANAVGSTTTNNFDLSTSAGAQLAATSMEKQPSCRAYKSKYPDLKSGVYVLSEVQKDYSPSHNTNEDGCQQGNPLEGTECGVQWYRMNRKRPEMKVYCDMEEDGGGWTLVMHEGTDGAMLSTTRQETNSLMWDWTNNNAYFGEREERLLDPNSKKGSKMPDDFINNIRTRHNQLSEIGYRTTSNNFKTKYFHHENCFYAHYASSNNPRHGKEVHNAYHPCSRYTTKIDAKKEDWVQCKITNDNGGINCWYGCNKIAAMTNVVSTAMGYVTPNPPGNRRSGIADNPKGEEKGSEYKDWGNDVLLWVR